MLRLARSEVVVYLYYFLARNLSDIKNLVETHDLCKLY